MQALFTKINNHSRCLTGVIQMTKTRCPVLLFCSVAQMTVARPVTDCYNGRVYERRGERRGVCSLQDSNRWQPSKHVPRFYTRPAIQQKPVVTATSHKPSSTSRASDVYVSNQSVHRSSYYTVCESKKNIHAVFCDNFGKRGPI